MLMVDAQRSMSQFVVIVAIRGDCRTLFELNENKA